MGRVVFVLCSSSMATVQWPQSQRICIVSLQHFGGRSGITGWGQGAQHPTTGPCRRSCLTLALPIDHGCFWILGQKLIAYGGQLGQHPPVLISPSLIALGALVWSHRAHCGRSGLGRHQQLPLCFHHVQGGVGHLLILKHRSSGPRDRLGQARAWLRAAGMALPAAGSRLQPAPCLGVPTVLHQRQTCIPVPEQSPACSGVHPLPLLPGIICSRSCWGRSLSTRETKASYHLLIRMALPGPAESGCKNVAPSQAAPAESMGMWLLPTCPRRWALGQVAGKHSLDQGVTCGHEAPSSSSRVG